MTRPWRLAFQADPTLPTIVHLLLGMNAHINYDLPQATLSVITDQDFEDPALIDSRRRDHERIDKILARRVAAEDHAITGRPKHAGSDSDASQPAEFAALPPRGSKQGLAERR